MPGWRICKVEVKESDRRRLKDEGAIQLALDQIRRQYLEFLEYGHVEDGTDVTFHLMLTAQRPGPGGK